MRVLNVFRLHSGVSSAAIKNARKNLPNPIRRVQLLFNFLQQSAAEKASHLWRGPRNPMYRCLRMALRVKTKVLLAAESRLLWKSSITLHSDITHTHTHSDNHAPVLFIRAPERHLGPLFLC
jgi:hypothetical protein